MTNRRELADRLEAAECGSRELDRQIGELFDAPMGSSGDAVGLGYAKFTTSLDAALALAERVLGNDGEVDAADILARAVINATVFGFHADKPLAPQIAKHACAAILRARYDEELKGGEASG